MAHRAQEYPEPCAWKAPLAASAKPGRAGAARAGWGCGGYAPILPRIPCPSRRPAAGPPGEPDTQGLGVLAQFPAPERPASHAIGAEQIGLGEGVERYPVIGDGEAHGHPGGEHGGGEMCPFPLSRSERASASTSGAHFFRVEARASASAASNCSTRVFRADNAASVRCTGPMPGRWTPE